VDELAAVSTTVLPTVGSPRCRIANPMIVPTPARRFRKPTMKAHMRTSATLSVWTWRNCWAAGREKKNISTGAAPR
jgi:hypothetical protein